MGLIPSKLILMGLIPSKSIPLISQKHLKQMKKNEEKRKKKIGFLKKSLQKKEGS